MDRAPTRKAPKVQGMRRPSPSSSLTCVLWVATRIAPAQKNRVIFANRMDGDVHGAADHPRGNPKHRAENDMAELADGRVCEPRLEIIAGQSDEGPEQNCDGGQKGQPMARRQFPQKIDSEEIDRNLKYGEDPGLHHRHCVKERGDGRGRDHSPR